MWQEYFRLVKLKPGKVVTALLGEIDFSSDSIPPEKIKQLYQSGFPYLEITEEGKKYLYGIEKLAIKSEKKVSLNNTPTNRIKRIRSNA